LLAFLIKPPSTSSREEEEKGLYPPLGLLYLSASLRSAGHEVEVYDLDLTSIEALLNRLSSEEPDLVGLTTTTPSYRRAVELIHAIREVSDAVVAVGGPHATLAPEDFEGMADYVVVGEGESDSGDRGEDSRRREEGRDRQGETSGPGFDTPAR